MNSICVYEENCMHVEKCIKMNNCIHKKKLCLTDEVTNILTNANHPNPIKWKDDLELNAVRENEDPDNMQRVIINRYWYNQLRKCSTGTLYERLLLCCDVDDESYLKFFETAVLPTIIKHNLGT